MSISFEGRDVASATRACSSDDRVTKSLLGYGIVAGPFYVGLSLAQALAHPGFDLTRHAWSLLGAGPWGWVQQLNLILTGAMVIAFAVGLARSTATRWAPRLVGVFGLGMIVAGVCVADPMDGYPVGVPTPATPSWHSVGHMVAGSVGFLAMVVGTQLLARTFARQGRTGLSWWSRITGVFFLLAIIAIGSGSAQPVLVLGFTAGVIGVFALIAGVARQQYRRVGSAGPAHS
jgi:hypothetical membrane protein